MNSIFLLFGVAIAIASVTSLPATSGPEVEAVIAKVCQKAIDDPAEAAASYDKFSKMINANQKAEKFFLQTLAYINNANNKAGFLAGGQSCTQYFTGLRTSALSDYQANGLSAQAAEQTLAQLIANSIARIQAAVGAK